jgi:AGCS family alanine or glycine:cation symporter
MWDLLDSIDNFFWSYIGFPAAFVLGIWLSFKLKFVQVRKFPQICSTFFRFLLKKDEASTSSQSGVSPMTAFFAGLGGCVGIGNLVAVTTAVQIGGPGAVFWMWCAAIVGSILKYAEVFLGIRYRVECQKNGFRGGPMYILSKRFAPWVGSLFCVLMCLYGVEIFQFSVITSSVSSNFGMDKLVVTLGLLGLVILAEVGGVKRVGGICSTVIPLFIILYLSMGLYVLFQHSAEIPKMLVTIVQSAFTPHAALGSFVGAGILATISQGFRRAYYSSDIGVGYASIIHAEARTKDPAKQASLVIFDVFLDSFVICTMSVFLILVTGVWKEEITPMLLVQEALSSCFPYMNYFVPFFLFLLGYSTIITFFCAGVKTAEYLHPKRGKKFYYLYAITSLFIFSFAETSQALILMSIVQFLLLVLNLAIIFRLHKEVTADIAGATQSEVEHAYPTGSL